MMKAAVILIIVMVFTGFRLNVFAQASPEEGAVKVTLQNLFRAMETRDTILARNMFTKRVTTATVFRDKSGVVQLDQDGSVADFIKAIGSPHAGTWYEEAWDYKIEVDGDFAQAWCDYAFYIDNNFSHCGVDAFHLVKTTDGWKIFHLADTRRKSGCIIPEEIKSKHR
jgi:hypothetical protein